MPQEQHEQDIVDFVQSVGLLVRRLRAAGSTGDLSLTEAMVMVRLFKEGPATTADLARAEGVRPQSMRTTLLTLEELGMVERVAHPTDGRQVNIQLTALGLATRNNEREAKLTWITKAFSKFTGQEREALFAAGKMMKRLVEQDQ